MTDQGSEITPPEDRIPREPKEYPLVDMGNGRIGIHISNPGDSLELFDIFGEEAGELGGEQYTGVYIKDENGNMYWLRQNKEDLTAEIVDANESRKAGGRLHVTTLDSEELSRRRIVVKETFDFDGGITGSVTGIWAINDQRVYPEDVIQRVTEGRKSNITTDFKTACLPIGAEPQK